MAVPSTIYGDQIFAGTVTFSKNINVPDGNIANADIASNAAIDYTKIVPLHCINRQLFAENVTVAALASEYLHVVRGTSGTNIAFQAFIGSVAGATDNTITIDLQQTTSGSSAFATVLSNAIVFRSTGNNTIYAPVSATFASTGSDLTAGDAYRLTVAVGGSTGTQPKGLHVQWFFSEAPA